MIQYSKRQEHAYEENANRYGEKLEQQESTIKEEGSFCIEWCILISVRLAIDDLNRLFFVG